MELGIAGKFALVTGGSHGIGLATARALAREGVNVALCARNPDRLNEAARELTSLGVQALGVAGDVLVPSDIERIFKTTLGAWGALHILVNNVGGGGRWGSSVVEDTPESVWTEVYTKNALAAVRFTRLAIPVMRKQKWGRVVTMSSIIGREGGGRPWFTMAKSAEISLMKTLAMTSYLVRDGITFNTVAPGSIMIPDTGWEQESRKDPVKFQEMLHRDFPMGRLGLPEEVASVVAFACSEQARLMNGATLVVDGGESSSF
jgi:3-oxoacyl-[acyl-carrier protein] reductase